MARNNCIFCKILAGDIPSYSLYEDEDTYVFLDINPVSNGHLLVIPKKHAETLTDLDEATAGAVFRTVRNVAEALENSLEPNGVNILQNNGAAAGQEVGHVHVHIIPRYADDGFEFSFTSRKLPEEQAKRLTRQISDRLGT